MALAARPGFAVSAVTCRDDHTGWSEAETHTGYRVVLVNRGRFRRMADGLTETVDPTMAYLGVPGEEQRFSHPAGGDVCTLVNLTPRLWRTLAGDIARPARTAIYVDARLHLAHRRFLAATGRGPVRPGNADHDYALAEELLRLLAVALEQVAPGPTPAGERASRDDRTLVTRAREAIAADHPAAGGLFPLAELLDVSPYRLSRAFSRELGVSLTRYRNRVRVGRALDRLEAGETSLGLLAADLGFADHAHLTRTVRDQLGRTPTALRRLLAHG
ncbi:AraC family transcriptional regulator [Planobispora longispora]|uniref:AraC family transcriptional regulator n=1 Tax=Planobispora longispora TaxID=28887 RepID=A0A8J3RKQ6_9ACTN|nr:helix-turn-helix transcriptional regulator [Planobispora longispora]GIH76450.1 AraC family transcriptional regulator [Planobispora longispora]